MKRFWHLSHIKQRREYYAGGLVVCNDSVETVRFAGGYFDSKLNPNYYITDYQGNNIAFAQLISKSNKRIAKQKKAKIDFKIYIPISKKIYFLWPKITQISILWQVGLFTFYLC